MSTRVNAARARAKSDREKALNVLARSGVAAAPSLVAKAEHMEGREYWTLQHTPRLEVWAGTRGLQGRWSIQVKMTYDTEPQGDAAYVSKGSLTLERALDDEAPRSFIRYDVDVRIVTRLGEPCHLNVLQPPPFDDRLHLRIPGLEIKEWNLAATLEFLSSTELRDEIVERFG